MVFTKAEYMYEIACKIIRPYTVYSIIRENYEHKDFVQSLWEMWKFIGIFIGEEKKDKESLPDSKAEKEFARHIDEISEGIVQNYLAYIDELYEEVKKGSEKHTDELDECLRCMEELRGIGIIDERALQGLRRLEEAVY